MKIEKSSKECLRGNKVDTKVRSIRAAIYARYSSEMQNSDSIEDQITIIKEYLKSKRIRSRKWPNCEIEVLPKWILCDEAQSGRSNARENYLKIRDGIRQDEFDLLLVDNLSRATRDLGGTMDLYSEIKFYGKELVSASEGLSTEDPMAKTFFAVKGIVNDLENDTRANCTKRGMIGKYLRGYSCGTVPFGYVTTPTAMKEGKGQRKPRDYKVSIDEEKASIIRRAFQLYAGGMGAASIARTFNDENISWPSYPKGKGWAQNTITKIFSQRKYIGEWVWATGSWITNPTTGKKVWRERPKNEWVYFNGKEINEDLVIVEPELWARVQKIKQKLERVRQVARSKQKQVFARKPNKPSQHLLTGLLACRECRSNMIIITARHGGYYGCFEAHRKGNCKNRSLIRAQTIEDVVSKKVGTQLRSDKFVTVIAKKYNEKKKKAAANYHVRKTARVNFKRCGKRAGDVTFQ